jgi:hypothetical protein
LQYSSVSLPFIQLRQNDFCTSFNTPHHENPVTLQIHRRHHRIHSLSCLYTKNPSPTSRNHISHICPTNLLRHADSISSDPHPPGLQASTSPDSSLATKRGLSHRLHCCSTGVARTSSVWYMRNALCQSAPRSCAPWSPRRWWCVVGIPGAGGRGWEMVKMGGYKGVRMYVFVYCFG